MLDCIGKVSEDIKILFSDIVAVREYEAHQGYYLFYPNSNPEILLNSTLNQLILEQSKLDVNIINIYGLENYLNYVYSKASNFSFQNAYLNNINADDGDNSILAKETEAKLKGIL